MRFCGSSSVDRALAFQAEGRGFEPRLPLSKEVTTQVTSFFYPKKTVRGGSSFTYINCSRSDAGRYIPPADLAVATTDGHQFYTDDL